MTTVCYFCSINSINSWEGKNFELFSHVTKIPHETLFSNARVSKTRQVSFRRLWETFAKKDIIAGSICLSVFVTVLVKPLVSQISKITDYFDVRKKINLHLEKTLSLSWQTDRITSCVIIPGLKYRIKKFILKLKCCYYCAFIEDS